MKSCQEHGDLQVQKKKKKKEQQKIKMAGQDKKYKWQIKCKHSSLSNRLHILKPTWKSTYITPCEMLLQI